MADQLLSAAAGAPLPASFTRPESQRPRLLEAMSGATIPTVDLGSPDKPQKATQVAAACQANGVSQAALDIESGSPPAPGPSVAEAKPTSWAELASPAALCVAIYGSIPQDVQLHHRGNALYNPLMAFICLGVLASLCNVIYALVRRACGSGDGNNVKRRVTGVAVAFFLVAFVLRVLLVH